MAQTVDGCEFGMDRGEIYEFCVNHVLELSDPMEAFRLTTMDLAG